MSRTLFVFAQFREREIGPFSPDLNFSEKVQARHIVNEQSDGGGSIDYVL